MSARLETIIEENGDENMNEMPDLKQLKAESEAMLTRVKSRHNQMRRINVMSAILRVKLSANLVTPELLAAFKRAKERVCELEFGE